MELPFETQKDSLPFEEGGSSGSSLLKEAGGFATGVLDIPATIIPAAIGTLRAAGGVATKLLSGGKYGETPSEAFSGVSGVIEEANPLTLLYEKFPGLKKEHLDELRKTTGYEIGSLPLQTISKALEGYGSAAEYLAVLLKMPERYVKEASPTAQLGIMLSTLGLGAIKPKPGSAEAFRDVEKIKPSNESLEKSKEARKGYPKEESLPF